MIDKKKLELASKKYIQAGYIMTHENSNSMSLVDLSVGKRKQKEQFLWGQGQYTARDSEGMVTLRINSEGIIEEHGYTLDTKGKEEKKHNDNVLILVIFAIVMIIFLFGLLFSV